MPSKPGRSSEHNLAFAGMKYLDSLPGKRALTADFKANIPGFITLTREDREPADSRNNEEKWQQLAGNIVSHRHDSPENFINRGLLAYENGLLLLTSAGEAYLRKHSVS